mgnify:CR=1 FL=1
MARTPATEDRTAIAQGLLAEAQADSKRLRELLVEIDCRIEHGADSNGHLEGLRSLYAARQPDPAPGGTENG